MPEQKIVIGLFGFGVVGEGLYRLLQDSPLFDVIIKKICINNIQKVRNASSELFTIDRNDLLHDDEINVIVEATNDSDVGFEIVCRALQKGKHVISASKKMIAEHLESLLLLQKKSDCSFLYEASVCASIPIIRNLEEYYDNTLIHSIQAIVNGSTNYILTKMLEDNIDFNEALKQAQSLGFAESDPKLDIEGYDAVNKWILLLYHAFGIVAKPEEIVFNGIKNITIVDITFAKEHGFEIKLVAHAKKLKNGKIAAFILPEFVQRESQMAFVKNEYNGVIVENIFADQQFFYGKGAGGFPTASALLSDIAALRYNYKYKKRIKKFEKLGTEFFLKSYIRFDNEEDLPLYIHDLKITGQEFITKSKSFCLNLPVELLLETDWWKINNISLIIFPSAIFENQSDELKIIQSIC